MERTRVAALAALFVVLSVGGGAFAAVSPGPLAAVAWPVSTLLVTEVQTGGASASDEFAEITNVGPTAVDLAGLELAYATSTGSTVTRKASWSASLLLLPGRHLSIANTLGIYASLADATYSGGFAATGGAIVLRPIGGTPIDAVGWGDATNAFVEGSTIGAPAAGSSIERKPGGLSGNTLDTNANSTDWFTQAAPNPQSLSAPPVPAPGGSPTPQPTQTVAPTPTPVATATPAPTEAATPIPTATETPGSTIEPTATPGITTAPTPEPTPEPTPSPTPEPTTAPTPTQAPTPEPTPTALPGPTTTPEATPSPTPTRTPAPTATSPVVMSISDARNLVDGSTATVVGVLTTRLGGLESGRKAFIQDTTAGIAVYLDPAVSDGLTPGSLVMATGSIDDRFAERTLRVNLVDLVPLGEQALPAPVARTTGSIDESVEGLRVLVAGVTVGSPSDLSDGLGIFVDDGTGQVRVIVGPEALGTESLPSGTSVIVAGTVGQRDSSGTGLAGYRVHATLPGDLQVVAPSPTPTILPTPLATASPSPTPTLTPTPGASPSPTASTSPSPTPSPTPTPSPAPTQTPTPAPTTAPTPTAAATPAPTVTPSATPGPTPPPAIDIVEARAASIGTVVTVAGVVTAEAGRLGLPPVLAIADGTGGIAVRLPDDVRAPPRGTTVVVRGPLADPYGQLELRPTGTGFRVTGAGSLPAPLRLTPSQLGEATEGRLAEIAGMVASPPRKGTSGDLTIDLVDLGGTSFRVLADGSSGIATADLVKGRSYRLTGIVGQHASRKGALDGYRLYLRDRGDISSIAAPVGPDASPSPGASGGSGSTSAVPVSTALAVPDGTIVTIEATVSAGANLLDASGRRIVVQDATGAIEVRLPTDGNAPPIGARVRVTGTAGRAWGAPRIAASVVERMGAGAPIQPQILHRAPAERDEWLLVRISGTVTEVNRIGERWRAEVTLADGSDALVLGQPGSGIPSTAIVVGRGISVTGIVRRPYSTASDHRFAVLPRSTADVSIAGTGAGTGASPDGGKSGSKASGQEKQDPAAIVTPDTDLATLADLVGQRVKVGGLVVRVAENGFDLDDGTALARVVLEGDMAALLSHISEHEAVAATGVVRLLDGAPAVVVDETGTLVRVGTLGQALSIGGGSTAASADPGGSGPVTADTGHVLGAPAPTSLIALAGLTALSLLATILRRRRVQRRLHAALVERLSGLRSGGEVETERAASPGGGGRGQGELSTP